MKNTYDLLIIGGGISSCVFASEYLKNNFTSKIAIIEAGRGLGGRSSTRISKKFNGWELDHGSPNLNICNKKNNKLLKNFIEELIANKFIKFDDSELIELSKDNRLGSIKNSEFSCCNNFLSLTSMSKLSQNIIALNNLRNQIDFYFENLIFDLDFEQNIWHLNSKSGVNFKSKFLVCSSNLLLHKRSKEFFNTNQIPLRKAIPKNKDQIIDSLLKFLEKQSYIQRLTFLIYTNPNYRYKDSYNMRHRYFLLKKDLENKYKFERVVFQLQKNNQLGIVIHTKSIDFIKKYIIEKKEDKFKQNIIKQFNNLFEFSSVINQLSGEEAVSIMRWKASQPLGIGIPLSLQISKKHKIGFCGDWFENDGFGRIEGSIFSALKLANKFNSLNLISD